MEKGDDFVSGEEISRRIGLSRTAVWKHIQELRREGYQIEARQKSGYRLVCKPDRILQEEIAYGLRTRTFGQALRTLKSVDSTQKIAHQWAREGAPEGAAVIAQDRAEGRAQPAALGIVAVLLGGGQWFDVAVVGVHEAPAGGQVHPGHQLGLERHGARTLPGLCARVGLRLLALAAGLWHNAEIGQPGRSFSAYGH